MAEKYAKLSIETNQIEFPILKGTLGPKVIQIAELLKAGYFTFDPGFLATAACESKITFINGNKGQLLYRGYPIEQIANQCDYMATCYLLLKGELPTPEQKTNFITKMNQYNQIDLQFQQLFTHFPSSAHPMSMLMSTVSALASFHHDEINVKDPDSRYKTALQLIAKVPILAAMCYRHNKQQEFILSNPGMGFTENFLNMLFYSKDTKTPNPVLVNAMDKIFILHADHEQNASTSTVRLAGSSGADPFACIAAGIASLWGPAHGGANEAVIKMLEEIKDVKEIPKFVNKAKDKNDPFRLMGFGHRVYKNYDPRAKIMREICHEVLQELNMHNNPLLMIALTLEKIALEDDYFIQKKLYPNVDFYSGIVLKAMSIPTNMFTVLFALARTIGWVTHWEEMMNDPEQRIGRPRQLYTGSEKRDIK